MPGSDMGTWRRRTPSLVGASRELHRRFEKQNKQVTCCLGRWGRRMLLVMRGASETTSFNQGWSRHRHKTSRDTLWGRVTERPCGLGLFSPSPEQCLRESGRWRSALFLQKAFLCTTAQQVRADLLVPLTRGRRSDKRTKFLEPMTSFSLQLFLLFETLSPPLSL